MSDIDTDTGSHRTRLFRRWFNRTFWVLMLAFLLTTPHLLNIKFYGDPVYWLFIMVVSGVLAFLLAGFRAFFVEPDPPDPVQPPRPNDIRFNLQIAVDQTGTVQLGIVPPSNTGELIVLNPPVGEGARP